MKKIHFIGIGGIGVSALARYYLVQGWEVSGSDLVESVVTNALEKEGMKIYSSHDSKVIKGDLDEVVYSTAVGKDNTERAEAKRLGIPLLSYAEALGELTKQYKTIAVSGSHGKGTTASFLALMMIEAGFDPTVIIGTQLKEFGGKNFRAGKGDYLLIEADEYNRSFWDYHPTIAVITNVDKEHLDVFENLEGVVAAFHHYVKNIPKEGIVIINAGDRNSAEITDGCECEVAYFNNPKEPFKKWPLKVPGEFNQLNAEAAWQAARILGIDRKTAEKAVAKYGGSWRRMEPMEPMGGFDRLTAGKKVEGTFFNDYAHHPTEIKATIRALKGKYPDKKLLVIFEPHQTRRLTNLFEDFLTCFGGTDELVLLPVYEVAGREGTKGKTSEDLHRALIKGGMKNIHYLQNLEDAFNLIQGQVVVFMGAGTIDGDVRKYFRSKLLATF